MRTRCAAFSLLAVDPGTQNSHWLILSGTTIVGNGFVENDQLAARLRNRDFPPFSLVAIEHFHGMGMPVGKEVFETCYYIGALTEICESRGVRVMRVYRRDVKLALCGSPRAKDTNVRQALIDLLGAPGTKKKPGPTFGISSHGWSALAIAWYARSLETP